MKNIKYIILLQAAALTIMSGCKKSYDDPAPIDPVQMTATHTIAQLKAMYTSDGHPVVISDPTMVIEGRVTSTDRYGNFYRSFYIEDVTGGIEIKIGTAQLYNTYKMGQWVYIKPDQLCLGKYRGLFSLGYASDDPKYETAYINVKYVIEQAIYRGIWDYQTALVPVVITSGSQLSANVGRLVKVMNASYVAGTYRAGGTTVEGLTTWAHAQTSPTANDSYYGEQAFTIPSGAGTSSFIVRTSGYANFASDPVNMTPGQTADLTGIMTVFMSGTTPIYQLILNNDSATDVVRH